MGEQTFELEEEEIKSGSMRQNVDTEEADGLHGAYLSGKKPVFNVK